MIVGALFGHAVSLNMLIYKAFGVIYVHTENRKDGMKNDSQLQRDR